MFFDNYWFLIFFLWGYSMGSVPYGLILTRMFTEHDIRKLGSGNIGATNVLRSSNAWLAGATLFCDTLKGFMAVIIVTYVINVQISEYMVHESSEYFFYYNQLCAGAGAFIGHVFPVWLRFKGGKGVATYLGVLLALDWRLSVVFCISWIATACAWRIASLASIIAVLIINMTLLFYYNFQDMQFFFTIVSATIIIKHVDNIKRIIYKTENKIKIRK